MKSRDIVPFGIARLHSLSRFPSGDFGLRVSQIWYQNMGKRAAYIVFYYGKRKKRAGIVETNSLMVFLLT